MPPVRIAVFASGRGSNLQALLDALEPSAAPGRVALIVSNRADAGALDHGRSAGIPAVSISADGQDAAEILGVLQRHSIRLIVLAGYLKLLPDAVVAAYRGRILNVHPALLPQFGGPGMYGRRVHEAVLASGVRLTGVTIHAVDEQFDRGPILAQWPVPVRPGDTAEKLAARVLEIEHRLLPAVVRAVCRQLAESDDTPRALAAAADAFVLSALPESRIDDALVRI